MSKIGFRPCLPNDFIEAIPLIFDSGPAAFNYVFKNNLHTAQDFLRFAFQSTGGEFSFDNHQVMLKDQKIIGIGSIFSGKRAKSFAVKDALKIIRFYGWRSPSILWYGLKIEQILKLPKNDELCLAHIAIHPDERSKGYGQQLLEFLMDQVKNDGCERYVLDVSVENIRAKDLYERMGFVDKRLTPSKLSNKYGRVIDHVRMEKTTNG